MKKLFHVQKLILIALLFVFSSKGIAQLSKVGGFIGAGKDDATALMGAYLEPFVNSFGSAINGGWYNTAEVHKPGGFDLTFSINTAFVPKDIRDYDLNSLDLSADFTGKGSGEVLAPSISSKMDNRPMLTYTETTTGISSSIDVPNGINATFSIAPVIQAGIGIFKDTEIDGRYVPNMKFGQTTVGLWGVGLKHGLKQWIPAMKRVPIINFTLQGAYTRLNTSNPLTVTPATLGLTDGTTIDGIWDDQEMNLIVQGFTSNLIFSIDVPVFSIYAGAGIATSSTLFSLNGTYPDISAMSGGVSANIVNDDEVIENPIDQLKIENKELKTTKPRLNGGIRFKFGVITLHCDYTYANYSVVSGGLGISFR